MVYDKKVLVVFSDGINTYIQQVLLLKEGERRSALSAGIPACSLNKTEKKKHQKLQDPRGFTTDYFAMHLVRNGIYHMTRTAPRAISLETMRENVPYEGHTRRSEKRVRSY